VAPFLFEEPDPFGARRRFNAAHTRMDTLALKVGQQFEYLFDFGDSWWHEIRVEPVGPVVMSKYLILDSLPEDIRANPQSIVEAKAVSAERLRLLNMPIEAGSTKVVILGMVFDAYDPQRTRRAEQLLVALDLVFANGYRHTFLGAFAVETLPTAG